MEEERLMAIIKNLPLLHLECTINCPEGADQLQSRGRAIGRFDRTRKSRAVFKKLVDSDSFLVHATIVSDNLL